MFTIKILFNNLNPMLRLSSVDDIPLAGSKHNILHNRQTIRHNGKRYIWRVR